MGEAGGGPPARGEGRVRYASAARPARVWGFMGGGMANGMERKRRRGEERGGRRARWGGGEEGRGEEVVGAKASIRQTEREETKRIGFFFSFLALSLSLSVCFVCVCVFFFFILPFGFSIHVLCAISKEIAKRWKI